MTTVLAMRNSPAGEAARFAAALGLGLLLATLPFAHYLLGGGGHGAGHDGAEHSASGGHAAQPPTGAAAASSGD